MPVGLQTTFAGEDYEHRPKRMRGPRVQVVSLPQVSKVSIYFQPQLKKSLMSTVKALSADDWRLFCQYEHEDFQFSRTTTRTQPLPVVWQNMTKSSRKKITHVTFTVGKNKQNFNHIWPHSELLTLATASCKDKQHSKFKSQDMPSFY